MKPRALLFTALLATGVAAQNVATFPSDHAAIQDGDSYSRYYPFSNGVSRIMLIYESWDLNIPAGRQITRIGFRRDGTRMSTGHQLLLEVRMAQTEKDHDTAEPTFADNYFGSPTVVRPTSVFTMPDMGNVLNPNPNDPFIWVPLTTPWTYDPGKNLLVEFLVQGNSNGGARFDYWLDRALFESPVATGPNGCQHSGGQIPHLASRETKVGGNWYCDLTQAPANQLAIWFIALNTPLQPQYSLAPLFPGIPAACQGQIPLVNLFSVVTTTDAFGRHTFRVPIPDDRTLNDMIISSQAACFDVFSPGNLVVSNGDQLEIGIDPAMAMIHQQGSTTATRGTVSRNYGLVTLFDHN